MTNDLEVSITVNASGETVWDLITDLPGSTDRISGIDKIEVLDGGTEFRVGTRWRETRKMFGKSATEEMVVTEVNEGTSYSTRADHGSTVYVSTMTVDQIDDAHCRLTMGFGATTSGRVGGALSKLTGWAMASSVRKMMQADLRDIASAAESAADTENPG